MDTDTFSDYHTYEIDWQPDTLTWSVDGKEQRKLTKKETFNKTDNQYHYPQTPSRVQLSLWPAGLEKNGKGTVDWAGGKINWNAEDVQTNGYYYAMYKSVKIECYDPPSNTAGKSGDKSYVYTDSKLLENNVAITGNDTVLKSLLGSGTDMDKDFPKSKPKDDDKDTDDKEENEKGDEVATIPGLSGAGPGTDGTRGDDDSTAGGSSGGSGGDATASGNGGQSTGVGGFTQNDGSSGSSGASRVEGVVAGSMVAVLMAFVGMMLL